MPTSFIPGVMRAPESAAHRDVTTSLGVLRGSVEGDLVRFRGVRYATAGRFEPPVPVTPWSGIRNALEDGPMCPQPPFGLSLLARPKPVPPQNEDCFFLTITAPAAPSATGGSGKGRPVMVWIHGGAYVNGQGGGEIYDAGRLVESGDVIVVGINYRLGVFGYLPIENIAPANLGVLDQLEALRWVHEHIADFGGDPGNVTLFGQSAGADAIATLLTVTEADAYYRRAILQSAPLGLDSRREVLARALGARVVAHLAGNASGAGGTDGSGVDTGGAVGTDAGAGSLDADPRTASVEALLEAQVASYRGLPGDRLTAGMPFAPTPGSWPVPAKSERAERWARRAPNVELIVGYNRDDFSPFLEVVPALRSARASTVLKPATEPLSRGLTRRVFGAPALQLAAAFAAAGARVYTYRFDWRPKGTPWGACHCLELPAFWATEEFWEGSPMMAGVDWQTYDRLGSRMRRAWLRFAATGSPAGAGGGPTDGGVDSAEADDEWMPFSKSARIGAVFTLPAGA